MHSEGTATDLGGGERNNMVTDCCRTEGGDWGSFLALPN